MVIQKFKDFINENKYDYSADSWINDTDRRIISGYDGYRSSGNGYHSVKMANMLWPLLGKKVYQAGRAISDFLTPKKKLKDADFKSRKIDILNSWEDENLKDGVSQKNADKLYKSGVITGKKYFGGEYNPLKPRNTEEKEYSDYFSSAMERYYKKLKKDQD